MAKGQCNLASKSDSKNLNPVFLSPETSLSSDASKGHSLLSSYTR